MPRVLERQRVVRPQLGLPDRAEDRLDRVVEAEVVVLRLHRLEMVDLEHHLAVDVLRPPLPAAAAAAAAALAAHALCAVEEAVVVAGEVGPRGQLGDLVVDGKLEQQQLLQRDAPVGVGVEHAEEPLQLRRRVAHAERVHDALEGVRVDLALAVGPVRHQLQQPRHVVREHRDDLVRHVDLVDHVELGRALAGLAGAAPDERAPAVRPVDHRVAVRGSTRRRHARVGPAPLAAERRRRRRRRVGWAHRVVVGASRGRIELDHRAMVRR